MGNIKINYSSLIVILILLNITSPFLEFFGFHTQSLIGLSISSIGFLILLFFLKPKDPNFLQVLFIFIFLFFLGYISNLGEIKPHLVTDMGAFGILSLSFLLEYISRKQLQKIFVYSWIISMVFFISILGVLDSEMIQTGVERAETFKSISSEANGLDNYAYLVYSRMQLITGYMLLFLLCFPLFYQKQYRKANLIGVIGALTIIVTFSIYFQKRQPFVELIIIGIFYFSLFKKTLQKLVPQNNLVQLFLVALFFILSIYSGFFENIFVRFNQTTGEINKFDRLVELNNIFGNYEWYSFIIGKGLGVVEEETAGGLIMHIGYGNFIMKGGILLLVFYLVNVFKSIRFCWAQKNLNPYYNMGIAFGVFSLVQLSYAPGYHWFFSTAVTGFAMFSRFFLPKLLKTNY